MSSQPAAVTDPIALLYPELDHELTLTRAMLAIVPWEHADWKPHPRSGSLGKLACHIAQLPEFAVAIAALDVLHFNPDMLKTPELTSTDDLLALFDAKEAALRGALSSLDTEKLEKTWTFQAGERVIMSGRRAKMLRHMGINHIVHHRAQLGVYLRLLDVKIPGSYGPSAET